MSSAALLTERDTMQLIAERAAASTLAQLRRGAIKNARTLYTESHSILRALRRHFAKRF